MALFEWGRNSHCLLGVRRAGRKRIRPPSRRAGRERVREARRRMGRRVGALPQVPQPRLRRVQNQPLQEAGMIPDEAIQPAVDAWNDAPEFGDALMDALEAAAPYIRAQALLDAAELATDRDLGLDGCITR